jgi:undecaprenyl-phosphate 4-deoxy-4-formamido-L-arabinose transferase
MSLIVSGVSSARDVAERPASGPELSVVIPVFNEEQNIPELYRRLASVLETMPEPSEIVFVNDGSTDESGRLLEAIQRSDSRVTLVDLAYNAGQHAAVLAGFRVSRGDTVVTLDADLQNPPEEIPKLLTKIREGFDVVGGLRQRRQDALARKALGAVVRVFSKNRTDYGCMLRAYRREIVRRVLRCGERSVFIPALAEMLARRVTEVPVAHEPRRFGRSRYSTLRLMRLGFDWLTGFSMVPIQMVSVAGIVTALAGFVFGVALVAGVIPVKPDLTAVFALFALLFIILGVVLLAIGLVGEYVGRIYLEVRRRPRYVIESIRRGGRETQP